MKLLFDENLSDKIVPLIVDLYPESTHLKAVGLERAEDGAIAHWAERHGFTIVSKDTDFYQRSIAFGHPPKFIWLRVGNCTTSLVTNLLRVRHGLIRQFIESQADSVLVLERPS